MKEIIYHHYNKKGIKSVKHIILAAALCAALGTCGLAEVNAAEEVWNGHEEVTQTSHTENIPYALINQLELNVESHSRTLLCTQTTHPKSGQIVQESFQERFDQQDF